MTNNPENPSSVEDHKGTLFFPLPDGSAILYNLIGTSKAPLPVSTVDLNI
jgi:hydrocephalus-inducing protein